MYMLGDEVKKTVKTYNETVEEYYKKTKGLKSSRRELNEFTKFLPKNAKILDAGCGPGRDAKLFSDKGFEVIGIDLAEKMIEFAKKLVPKADFRIMDFRELGFKANGFDAVYFNAALLNVKKQDAEKTLGEMHRVLKLGGLMFLKVKEGKGEGFEKDKRYAGDVQKYVSYYSPGEIKQKAVFAGFKILKIKIIPVTEEYDSRPQIILYCKK
ncbi:MAG: class I SAM-dependent methyltransferase [Candidatus Diapherotrites archaeon]|nr:class I SAM-dependent methyltransferase [Candidatus Diapherotrites archaeon]